MTEEPSTKIGGNGGQEECTTEFATNSHGISETITSEQMIFRKLSRLFVGLAKTITEQGQTKVLSDPKSQYFVLPSNQLAKQKGNGNAWESNQQYDWIGLFDDYSAMISTWKEIGKPLV